MNGIRISIEFFDPSTGESQGKGHFDSSTQKLRIEGEMWPADFEIFASSVFAARESGRYKSAPPKILQVSEESTVPRQASRGKAGAT